MSRRWFWLQLMIGWLPVWGLFATLILAAHPRSDVSTALIVATRMIVAGALLGLIVQRLPRRLPWPRPFRPSFLLIHVGLAIVYAILWLGLNALIEGVVKTAPVFGAGPGIMPFLMLGVWLYVMVAVVSYATQANERAARAEVEAARAQLSALRAQLHPHFLFNALHTVVHLMPRDPQRAAKAAEELAGLLRTTIEEDRDLVSLAEEWSFVERYLAVEGLRFGDRLRVEADLPDETRAAAVPSFALQTLVENAVRHGATPNVAPTTISVTGRVEAGALTVTVRDTGAGADLATLNRTEGTGLRRLRERLAALYGRQARLDLATPAGGGFSAALVVPRHLPDE
ncbi:MAG: histidine kinase [Cytophagaceae bacterium]|nr:histidine kinase [Gemmatimonadaceae bacterium]